MKQLFGSPVRVYVAFAVLALVGLYSVFELPVSLFPNSSRPSIGVFMSFQDSTPKQFMKTHGWELESQLQAIRTEDVEVEYVEATYEEPRFVRYKVKFAWGSDGTKAEKEVERVVNSFSSRLSEYTRRNTGIWLQNRNQGFLAVSYYSEKRSLNELFRIIEPVLMPQVIRVKDSANPGLFNPTAKEIRIEMFPEVMAKLKLFPKDIERTIQDALQGYGSGTVVQGQKDMTIQMPPTIVDVETLKATLIPTPSGKKVTLSEVSRVSYSQKEKFTRVFKTSGVPCLILFATPKPGGNIKRMSDEILTIVASVKKNLPDDIQYQVLVNPSTFIRSAIQNVFHEVALGALFAVLVLFLFIGSLRNTVTAAIEIPMSLVLAFILMRLTGMQLNLISLGGLALSVGMNVDASVVVMENIFRHFQRVSGILTFQERLSIVAKAVKEVRFPIVAATIASVVVFVPLAFTSELTFAILGDLAKTVIFSHGLSALVALTLVPTIRLHLIPQKASTAFRSPLSGFFLRLENVYEKALSFFLARAKVRWTTYGALVVLMVGLVTWVLPQLPKEIVGKPNTDWVIVGMNTEGNQSVKQMETQAGELEAELLQRFGTNIQYTFSQIQSPNYGYVMTRLRDKQKMENTLKRVEDHFVNTPFVHYFVDSWNPSELPIPDPPDVSFTVRGWSEEQKLYLAEKVYDALRENKNARRVRVRPPVEKVHSIYLKPNMDQWLNLRQQGVGFSPKDVSDLVLVATDGREIGEISLKGSDAQLVLRFPKEAVDTIGDIRSLPVGVGGKLVPLKALLNVEKEEGIKSILRKDGRSLFEIEARLPRDQRSNVNAFVSKTNAMVKKLALSNSNANKDEIGASVYVEDPKKDLNEALRQLGAAVLLSILLMFVVLVFQFGSVMHAVLVLVAVPLGLMGVLLSLFVFQSTLSLNSVLGMVLLNGLAVANSILLVVFFKRRVDEGMQPKGAAVEAARTRLRPILMTSLTTILGMLPIALGWGEGGNVLQPLGIAVSGGLWCSTLLTLFVVPALQASFMEWKLKRKGVSFQDSHRQWAASQLGRKQSPKGKRFVIPPQPAKTGERRPDMGPDL